MKYFPKERQEWIAKMLHVYGFINRGHLMRMFGVSVAQAANDMRDFQKSHPQAMEYNPKVKVFFAVNDKGKSFAVKNFDAVIAAVLRGQNKKS